MKAKSFRLVRWPETKRRSRCARTDYHACWC